MTLTSINTLAKEIRTKNPELSWQQALKQAGAQIKNQPKRAGRSKAITVALRINRFNRR